MKQIYFATKNKGKVASVSATLAKYGIEVVHIEKDLPEPRSDDLRKIAREKVIAAYKDIKKPVIAIDSGFYIHSLNGFPRAFVNFVLETVGIAGILRLVKGQSRECEFRSCLAYYDETLTEPLFFESTTEGILSKKALGKIPKYAWSELFLIFIPEGEEKTLAQMPEEEYENWREKRRVSSFAAKFAEWYIEK